MAAKGGRGQAKAEWKAVDGEQAKGGEDGGRGGKKGSGKGGRGAEGAPWNNGEERRQGGKSGGRKGGKDGASDDYKGGGWNQGGRQGGGNRGRGGGYDGGGDEYYEGGYGFGGGGGYGFGGGGGMHPWHQGAQDWQMPEVQPAPPPRTWTEYTSPEGTPYYYNQKTGLTQWERPAELDPPKPEPEPARRKADGDEGKGSRGPRDSRDGERRNDGEGRGNRRDGGGERRDDRGGGDDRSQQRPRNKGRNQKEGGGKGNKGGNQQDPSDFGPPGCNLFVFHLPDDWNDDDLNEYFAPHGTVMSAKVMKELGTGRSRGFGFVSYEDRVSAATAIKKMQGYKILGKRLKVEFKKGEGQDGVLDGTEVEADEGGGGGGKKSYPDDERLIGYLRAISAKNVVQSLKENEASPDDGDEMPGLPGGLPDDMPDEEPPYGEDE